MDNATLVLLGIYHGQANPDRIYQEGNIYFVISDIDKLIEMSEKFEDRHGDTNWEDSDSDWADTVAQWYNDTKDANWNVIPMVETDPYFKVKQEMSRFLSNDESDYDAVIKELKAALKSKKKRQYFIDSLPGVEVWEKVENEFTVETFCELIGLTH